MTKDENQKQAAYARLWRKRNKERHNKYMRQWFKGHPGYGYAKQKARKAELKSLVFDKLGCVCCHCGFSDKRALQIDHVNGGGTAEQRRNNYSAATLYRAVLKDTSNRYQVLCANCNWIKRSENKEHLRRYNKT